MGRRVALIAPHPVFGGAETYVWTLANGLVDRDWDVAILHDDALVPSGAYGVALKPNVRRVGIPIAVMRKPFEFSRRIAELACDVVHINQASMPAIAAAILARPGAVAVIDHNPWLRPRYGLRGRALALWVLRQRVTWVASSSRNAELMRRNGVRSSQIVVIPLGVSPEPFERLPTQAMARRQLGLALNGFVVGTIGRMSRVKRHDLLIEACASALGRVSDLRLVIVGDGELRDETQELGRARLGERALFVGHQPDAYRLLPAFDMFALPSDFEGFSYALMEAMAAGLAIVATDVEGNADAVTHGLSGVLVERGSAQMLGDAIVRVATSQTLREELGKGARSQFEHCHQANQMVDRTVAVYHELLRRSSPRL